MATTLRSNLLVTAALLAAASLMPAVGCMAASDDQANGPDFENNGITFEEWKETVYKDADGVWIVNGDVPIASERDLREFFQNHVQEGALVVHQAGGVDAKWDDAQKLNITYCVSDSFGSNYQKVVSAMETAGGAWAAAADIKFVHLSAEDSSCNASNGKVVFDVRPVSGQSYLARAFFPDQSRSTRNVLIDSSSFGSLGVWTLEGILRHELGHTLGFRHEHTRPEAGKCFEDNNIRPLTDYDSSSVMHYPQCNGTQTGDLVLTDKDKAGAASLYGAPGGANPPPPPSGGACAHDMCSAGMKLDPACDACVAKIVQADSYCGSTKWDSVCVGEVKSVCGVTCGANNACVHDMCVTGAKLSSSCDACVGQIGAADPFCVNNQWDSVCVSQVKSVCGITCQ